jgi:hypothetical protein
VEVVGGLRYPFEIAVLTVIPYVVVFYCDLVECGDFMYAWLEMAHGAPLLDACVEVCGPLRLDVVAVGFLCFLFCFDLFFTSFLVCLVLW